MATRTTFGHTRHASSPTLSRQPRPDSSFVLADLLRERAAIEPIRVFVPHLWTLLDAEIARVGAAAADVKTTATLSSLAAGLSRSHVAYPKRDGSPAVNQQSAAKKRVKIPVPADKFPEYNFVGRLLGPRGTTLKTLERDTGCKIMIRGKGSIRKDKEPDVRGKPGWEHVFNEALHVVIEVGDALDDAAGATLALQRAKEAVEVLLVPVPEERDSLKRQQLRALAIMNGTYRGASPSRSLDGLTSLPTFSTSPPSHQGLQYTMEAPGTPVHLGDSMASASMSHQLLPTFEQHSQDDHSLFHPVHQQYAAFRNAVFDNGPITQAGGRRTPSSGGTSPKPAPIYDNEDTDDMSVLTSKMHQCAVDEFASSSVGEDTPESSHSSEDGEPPAHIMDAGYAGAQVKMCSVSPGGCAETMVGVGGFLGQEFYNGAFSNGPSPISWDRSAPSASLPQFSSALYGFSPIPSPQVLTTTTTTTTSSSTVTPIERQESY